MGARLIQTSLDAIRAGEAACIVISNDRVIAKEQGRGVLPIMRLCENGLLRNATVVDKVVGRAAAMVMTHGGVTACHAITMSESAYRWLSEHGVQTSWETLVPYIINRKGDGMCPMEDTTKDLQSDEHILQVLKKKLAEITAKE